LQLDAFLSANAADAWVKFLWRPLSLLYAVVSSD